MSFPRALALVSVLAAIGLSNAAAQFPPPPGQSGAAASQSSPFPPPPGQPSNGAGANQQSPFPPPPGQRASPWPAAPRQANPAPARSSPFAAPQAPNPFSQQAPSVVCDQFPALRGQAEKDASAIKAASDRKASREEVCAAFNKFMGSEGKMVKFLETNRTACGVPPDAIKQVRAQHARTAQIRKNVCSAGAAPRGPSLSDALGGPILPDETPKPGRGTFDTLTGSPLAR